ncbi:MAG: cell envelope integrity protein TolA [Nitrospirae bacterium]|nr:MAG: cell envelope integrity protein TolA [Nitrospirota bacterium]
MRPVGVYSAFTFSVFIHLFLFIFGFILIKYSPVKHKTTYLVSLVSETATTVKEAPAPDAAAPSEKAPAPAAAMPQPKTKHQNETRLQDRLSELQAKKKLEKIATLRKVIDIGNRSETKTSGQARGKTAVAAGKQSPSGKTDYYSLVENRIRQNWIFPETTDKDLETVISIKIARDGTVTIGAVEKKSGNPLFDRSVLRAINNASPFPNPNEEMEIGVRFRP